MTTKLASGFTPQNVVVLLKLTRRGQPEEVWAYDTEFKGRKYFHIRSVWTDDAGDWNPGKGVMCPAENRDALCAAVGALVAKPAKAKKAA